MARFVEIGKHGAMVNVEQIACIDPAENKNEYIVHMIDGSAYCVNYDEFLEIKGQQGHQASDKKYAIKVFSGYYSANFLYRYLVINRKNGFPMISSNDDGSEWKAHFTEKEIENLKKQDDIAIDWDKVELEEEE